MTQAHKIIFNSWKNSIETQLISVISKFNLCLLILLGFSTSLPASNYKYHFKWGFLPVAELTFNMTKIPISDNNLIISFNLKTLGPLKVFKDYDVRGGIKRINEISHEYFIMGHDGGIPEEKIIVFSSRELPHVHKFIDDKGAKATDPISDLQVDPLTAFLMLIESVRNNNNNCAMKSSVYDGKRNLFVSSSLLKSTEEIIECKMNVDMRLVVNSKLKKWPFGTRERNIIFQFSRMDEDYPKKITIDGPYGRIVGIITK